MGKTTLLTGLSSDHQDVGLDLPAEARGRPADVPRAIRLRSLSEAGSIFVGEQ